MEITAVNMEIIESEDVQPTCHVIEMVESEEVVPTCHQ